MRSFFAQKKLLTILKVQPLSPSVKDEIKQLIRASKMDQPTVMAVAYRAISFLDDLHKVDNSARLKRYFFFKYKT